MSRIHPILCAALLGACRGAALEPPDDAPYHTGRILEMTHRATASALLIGPGGANPCGISATVDAETRYFARAPAGALQPATLAALGVGDSVAVYVSGPIAESCPVQGRADAVVRLGP